MQGVIKAQKEAIDIARDISRNQGSELVIYRPDGTYRKMTLLEMIHIRLKDN